MFIAIKSTCILYIVLLPCSIRLSVVLLFAMMVNVRACVCPQGVSLAQAREKGQLVFLEGLKESLSMLTPQETDAESHAMDFLRYKHSHVFLFSSVFVSSAQCLS